MNVLLVHGSHDRHQQLLACVEVILDLLRKTVVVLRQREVLTRVSIFRHEADKSLVVDVDERVFGTRHVGHVHVVRRAAELLHLLAGEDVEGNEVALRVSVLARLRRRDVDNLAGTSLDADVTALTDAASLHGVRGGRTRVSGFERRVDFLRDFIVFFCVCLFVGSVVVSILLCSEMAAPLSATTCRVGTLPPGPSRACPIIYDSSPRVPLPDDFSDLKALRM